LSKHWTVGKKGGQSFKEKIGKGTPPFWIPKNLGGDLEADLGKKGARGSSR